jgi:hypothetical protein
LADVAVMLAGGGEAIADPAVLRNQPGLFCRVASLATCRRALVAVDADVLARRAGPANRHHLGRGHSEKEGAARIELSDPLSVLCRRTHAIVLSS